MQSAFCLQVADQWQAGYIAAAASEELCRRTDTFPLESFYVLPETARNSATFSNVAAAANLILVLWFGNAPQVIKMQDRLQMFFALSSSALLELLQSRDLITDSETTILLLFSSWCEGLAGRASSEEQRTQLNTAIRYINLPAVILTELRGFLHSPDLMPEQVTELRSLQILGAQPAHNPQSFPKEWLGPSRTSTCSIPKTIELSWALPLADLTDLLTVLSNPAQTSTKVLPEKYGAGFLWQFQLVANNGELSCGISVRGVRSLQLEGDQGVPFEIGLPCAIQLFVQEAAMYANAQAVVRSGMLYGIHVSNYPWNDRGFGPWKAEWWAQLAEDACIEFKALVKVDNIGN